MEYRRYGPPLIVLAAGLFWALGGLQEVGEWWAPPSQPTPPSRTSTSSGSSGNALDNFELTETVSDEEVWVVRSPRAVQEDQVVRLSTPHVTYRLEGDTKAVITADRGRYYLAKQKLHLEGHVVVRRLDKNQVLRTDYLNWNRGTGTLRTEAPVNVELPQGTLQAVGMKAHLRKEILRFFSSVDFQSSS